MEVSRKEIRRKEGEEKVVYTGILADHSAKIPFVSWAELAVDTVVHLENAYVKKWKGIATLYIGKKTIVIEKEVDFPTRTELMKPHNRRIEEIINCKGAFDVLVEGDVVSEEKNKKVLDDGTGAILLELRAPDILFGTPVKARGNVVESERGYVLIAEKVKIKGEDSMITDMERFLGRYT
jgi:ssDNA-binding replication factor A large subunit